MMFHHMFRRLLVMITLIFKQFRFKVKIWWIKMMAILQTVIVSMASSSSLIMVDIFLLY